MAKHTTTLTIEVDPRRIMRQAAWAEKVAAERDRRRPNRAVTLPNRKKVADKKACRKKGGWD